MGISAFGGTSGTADDGLTYIIAPLADGGDATSISDKSSFGEDGSTAINGSTYVVSEEPTPSGGQLGSSNSSFGINDEATPVNGVVYIEGEQGPPGNDGVGIPAGGSTGQFLVKSSNVSYETAWSDTLDTLSFNQSPTGTGGVARFRWNDTDGTMDLGLKGGNVTLQLGQELVKRVVNKTATNITLQESAYQVVKIIGATGQRMSVDLAQGNSDLNSASTLGIVTETIANNQEGFITTSGEIHEINTTGSLQGETWNDGDILYLSSTTPGAITKVKPVGPNHTVILGYVEYAHAIHGKIFVKIDNGYELDELHNINITSVSDKDMLQYNTAQSVWKNVTPSQVKTDIGLGNVDNTSDVNKPVSTAQAAADTVVLNSAKSYADGLVVGLLDDRGNYNASGNVFPSSGGSGTSGAILKGDLWTISVGGTLGGVAVTIGDVIRALVDTPGNTAGNWSITENNIGYVAENSNNKDASGGYSGLTLFKLNMKNVAGTIISWLTNSNTVARTYTFPDKDGTVAMTSDITGGGDPTGSISMWSTASAPTGYLLCDGTAVSRTTYSSLFSVISTLYGVGDGSTTFNVPNLKNRVPIGVDTTVKVTVDNCDAAWTAGTNVTASLDTTDKQEGTSSVKLAIAAGATANQILGHRTRASMSFAGKTSIGFWIKSDIAIAANDLQLRLDDTAALASPIETLNIPALVANQWTKVYLTLATPHLDTAIISVGIFQVVDKGAFNLWIDDIATGDNYELGSTGGEKAHILTIEEMPAHTHPSASYFNISNSTNTGPAGGAGGTNQSSSVPSQGGGLTHNNLQPYITLNYIIKT